MEKDLFNFLRFRGQLVQLEGGTFDWQAGFKPSVNRLRIKADGFEQLKSQGLQNENTLEFFCTNDLTADLRIERLRIVDVLVGAITVGVTGVRAVDYILIVSDFRETFQPPRGGVLGKGSVLNPTPGGANSQQKVKDENPPLSNREVISYVLGLMGVNAAHSALPAGIDNLPPLRDRQWHGGSAATEAEKLFEEFGLVLCPQFNGTAKVYFIGEAPDPVEIDVPNQIPNVSVPGIDRRGQAVVLKSVEAVVETISMTGPREGSWQWMVQDPQSDAWVRQEDVLATYGIDLRDVIDGLTSKLPRFVMAGLSRLRGQLFRFIGLEGSKSQETVYRLLYTLRPPGTTSVKKTSYFTFGPKVEAKLARIDPQTKLWTNTPDRVVLTPRAQFHGWIMDLGEQVVQVTEPSESLWDSFAQLGPEDLKVTFSRQKRWADTSEPEYFTYGLRQELGRGVVLMDADECRAAMADTRTVVLHRKDFRLIYDAEATSEQQQAMLAEMRARADAAVRPWVAGSGEPPRQISAVGFRAVELSGKVAQVKWTQAPPRTDAHVQTWFLPSAVRITNLRGVAGLKEGEAWPGQQTTAAAASAEGSAGFVQPAVTLTGSTTPVAESSRIFPVLVTVDGGEAGGPDKDCSWTYKLEGITGTEIKGAVRKRPVQKRFTKCEYNRPDDRSLGIAYRDQEGVTQLAWAAQEIPATDRVDVITSVYWDDARKALVTTKRATLVLETDESSEQLVQFYNCDGGTT
jgi:hypothetical protein